MRYGRHENARLLLPYLLRITQDLRTTHGRPNLVKVGDQERASCTTSSGVSHLATPLSPCLGATNVLPAN